ncbi:MAG: hypothetical protein COB59_11980 [Rhodospirillaceae bacterium]|nr:MAG: hypothetical protein COB59_11980 [Rhodospirillaceae bacterium]
MKKYIFSLFATLAILMMLGNPAEAAGKKGITNSHARISPTMIAIYSPGKLLPMTRAVFPILTVPETNVSDGILAKVCQREANVKEAIIRFFSKNPAKLLRNGHIDVKALQKQKKLIAKYVNRKLHATLVSEVNILLTDPDKGIRKGVMARFPGARGCSRVASEFIELMKNRALGGKEAGSGK